MKYFYLVFISVLLLVCFVSFTDMTKQKQPVDYVNPLIGTDTTKKISRGNTYPAVSVPFAMTAWTPQTGKGRWIYLYKKNFIQGFRGTHQPSVWRGDYGSISIMPVSGQLQVDTAKRSSKFRHEDELATPYYYRVYLDDYCIVAELTATKYCGFFRFGFPKFVGSYVVINPFPGRGYMEILPEERKIRGYSILKNTAPAKKMACYFVGVFDSPIYSYGTFLDRKIHSQRSSIKYDPPSKKKWFGIFIRFKNGGKKAVRLKIATSFLGYDQAWFNLDQDIPHWDFNAIKEQGRAIWNRELKKIKVEGGTNKQLITFYTALYHSLLFPRTMHELNSGEEPFHFSPIDGKAHPGFLYTDLALWDVFRAQFPLLILIQPQTVIEIISGLLNIFNQGGWLPKWPSPGYMSMMIGSHVDSIIADTSVKGLTRFDLKKALEAMKKHATQKGDRLYSGRVGIEYYQKLGYVPADRVKAATSRTLEFAYGDYCIAQVAEALGYKKTYQDFITRSLNYRLVFDPGTGFMRGKNSDGTWAEPFNPLVWGNEFIEGNAWHYLWSVQHDVMGLVKLLGGREKFVQKLDKLFNQPSDFSRGSYKYIIHEMREMKKINMGQYAHNNEPLHHVPYLYNYAGQPWKTQERVRRIMKELYGPGPGDLCGDEDTGQMSAWYVFSAMGFYPVCPGQPIYVIGSPLFEKIILNVDNERKFEVEAVNNNEKNIYIQSATLNGKPYNKTWLKHSDIITGGKLVLIMGPEPNFGWGSQPENFPPSAMDYQE